MKTITAMELKERLEYNKVELIDVRDASEYHAGHINSAHLIPLSEISIDQLPLTKKPIVLYCHAGKRSLAACKLLLAQNPNLDLFNLEGGILAWRTL